MPPVPTSDPARLGEARPFQVKLPFELKAALAARSVVERRPQARLIEDAVRAYLEAVATQDRVAS